MRQLGSVSLCLLVLFLAGCPKQVPFLASPDDLPGTASKDSTAAPTPTAPAPSPAFLPPPFTLPLNSLAMTVKPVSMPFAGESSIPIEAREAILALSRTEEVPTGFGFAFDGATPATTGMPTLQSLSQAPGPACGTFDQLLEPKGAVPKEPAIRALRAAVEPPVVGARRDFYVRSILVRAVCVAVGAHGAIWLDERDQWRFAAPDLISLGEKFDGHFPQITEAYGAGPSGRADGYNWGDDRLNFLISQQVPQEYGGFVEPLDFFPDSFTEKTYGKRSNFGKVLYLNAIYGLTHLLNTMIHEYVHIVFYGHRLEVYSQNHGLSLPLGQDSSYFGWADASERWLNEGMAVLSEYRFGQSPALTYRAYLERYLVNPNTYDLADFLRLTEKDTANYGGALLFSAYAQARHPAFAKEVQLARGVSTGAVDEVMRSFLRRTFPEVYRDYALSLLLDGYHADVPGQYRIPYVDVFGDFGGTRMEGVTSSTVPPRLNGVRYVHVRFESGKGMLRLRNAGTMQGTLLLLAPASAPGFTGD
ncbi:hypothetical protein D3C72_95560 [compost metagenome]